MSWVLPDASDDAEDGEEEKVSGDIEVLPLVPHCLTVFLLTVNKGTANQKSAA